jgi:hypothetical protein
VDKSELQYTVYLLTTYHSHTRTSHHEDFITGSHVYIILILYTMKFSYRKNETKIRTYHDNSLISQNSHSSILYVNIRIYMYMYIHIYGYSCIYIFIDFICINTYIYIYTYIYTYTNIYIYIPT